MADGIKVEISMKLDAKTVAALAAAAASAQAASDRPPFDPSKVAPTNDKPESPAGYWQTYFHATKGDAAQAGTQKSVGWNHDYVQYQLDLLGSKQQQDISAPVVEKVTFTDGTGENDATADFDLGGVPSTGPGFKPLGFNGQVTLYPEGDAPPQG